MQPIAQDIYLPLNHLFSQATKKAFENVVTKIIVDRVSKVTTSTIQHTVYDQVRYFGIKAIGERCIFDAAKRLANQINDLASKGYITGVLGPKLSLFQLATEPHQLPEWLVLCYPCFSEQGLAWVESEDFDTEFKIGGIPKATVK